MIAQPVKTRGAQWYEVGQYALLVLLAFVFVFPIVFMVVSSLKPDLQLLRDTGSLNAFLPIGDISLNNYAAAFDRAPIPLFIFNSVFVTTTTVLLGLVVNSLAAFSFAFLRWRGKKLVLSVIIASFIIPFDAIAVPLLLLVNRLPWIGADGLVTGWLNSYHVQIIPFLVSSFQIFLFYQFFRDLPFELIEAARIDGASAFQTYIRVIMPVSGPVLATAAILRFLDMWNQYMWPLMVTQSEQYRPVMVGLQYFFQLDIAWGEIMAYLSLITIPVLILYLSLQRAFITSIASTGIKG
ncbi:MAG: carbohydrate ABC transporter permease [Anaerolineae bacterium]|nr:carbohydrate ABC transporter permease [Anaerolineae bacterium]